MFNVVLFDDFASIQYNHVRLCVKCFSLFCLCLLCCALLFAFPVVGIESQEILLLFFINIVDHIVCVDCVYIIIIWT